MMYQSCRVTAFGTDAPCPLAAKRLPDLVDAPQSSISFAFPLAGVGKPIAMPAQEIPTCTIQFDDAPTAGHAAHYSGADKIRPRSSKPACHAHNARGFRHILPVAATDPHAVRELETVSIGAQIDPSNVLAVTLPRPTATPARAKAARAMQSIDVN
jgi:hypothetical protein